MHAAERIDHAVFRIDRHAAASHVVVPGNEVLARVELCRLRSGALPNSLEESFGESICRIVEIGADRIIDTCERIPESIALSTESDASFGSGLAFGVHVDPFTSSAGALRLDHLAPRHGPMNPVNIGEDDR